MKKVSALVGREYKLFNYVGAPDAERVIIAMGSGCETIEETINYLNKKGEKLGLVKVHLYRPFSAERLLAAIPATCKKIAVLDRTKEPGSLGEPLYEDVCSALYENGKTDVEVIGGRYGLGSKEFNSHHGQGCVRQPVRRHEEPLHRGHRGRRDRHQPAPGRAARSPPPTAPCAACSTALAPTAPLAPTRTPSRSSAITPTCTRRATSAYDSKKSGGLTVSHLRFGKTPIQSTYLIDAADFVACHNPSLCHQVRHGQQRQGRRRVPAQLPLERRGDGQAAARHDEAACWPRSTCSFYTIDAIDLALKVGMGNRINTIMQAAFFKLAEVIPYEQADEYMKAYAKKTYGKKGDAIVKKNWDAIDIAISGLVEIKVPAEWANATTGAEPVKIKQHRVLPELRCSPSWRRKATSLPVSAFDPARRGSHRHHQVREARHRRERA